MVFNLYPVKKTCDPRVEGDHYFESMSVSPSKRSRSGSRSFHSRSMSRGVATSTDGDRNILKRSGDLSNFAFGSSKNHTPHDEVVKTGI